jgi:hypothetical protein
MDMSVSPDLGAYCCYSLVLLIGLLVAWSQVSKRLGRLPGQWIMVNTWLLFFAYTFVPVLLFWFLDRTNAVHDTSLFAALLVGFGYQQILSGSLGSIRVSGDASKFWQPFGAWADSISDRIRKRIQVNSSQFDERLLATIRADASKFDALKEVTLTHAADPKALDASLQAIAADKDVLGEPGVHAKQASSLYESLQQSSPEQFEYLLYKHDVISPKWYFWYAKEWRSKTTAIVVAAVLLASVAVAVWGPETRFGTPISTPSHRAQYYIWRLHKDNTTDYDHFRAETKLRGYLESTPSIYSELIDVLKVPNLPVKTADSVLGLIVETRQSAANNHVDLQALLVGALRAENSDIRGRIQKVLVYLANDRHATVPDGLKTWQSDPKQSSMDIDQLVEQWSQVK